MEILTIEEQEELIFKQEFERLKQELNVEPRLVLGEEAKKLISKYGKGLPFNGGYIHADGLNVVAVIEPVRLGTLAHEMRHAWQYKNKEIEGFNFTASPVGVVEKIKHQIVYFTGRKEYDANKFALSYCKRMGLAEQIFGCRLRKYATWFFKFAVWALPILLIAMVSVMVYVLSGHHF